jgi:ferrous iron transport protein B
MELPPYRVPTLRGVLTHMWSRTRSFVKKAWTIILAVSVLLWLFMALPPGDDGIGSGPVDESLFARAATAAAPLFAPLGFDSWQATGSLMTGLVAKEVVVSTMAQVYGAGAEDLSVGDLGPTVGTEAGEPASDGLAADLRFIAAGFARATRDTLIAIPAIFGIDIGGSEQAEDGPGAAPSGERDDEPSEMMAAIHADFERSSGGVPAAAGLAFMVFVLLYTPCVVAIAAARHEFGPRWMWTSVLGQFAVAWLVALAVYQFGRLVSG